MAQFHWKPDSYLDLIRSEVPRYDELQEALAESRGADTDLREARDVIHTKLGETVGALETIRLNLLRLHAGSATVESFTTHLGLANAVSEQVQRLIEAQDDVERALNYPRIPSPSPA